MVIKWIVTLPAGAVAKYCDEYVCVCVVLEDISGTTHDYYHFFSACCLWPWLGSSSDMVMKFQGEGQFWGFLFHWPCIVQHSIWDQYKNGWTNRDAVWDDEWAWPKEQCVRWGWRTNVHCSWLVHCHVWYTRGAWSGGGTCSVPPWCMKRYDPSIQLVHQLNLVTLHYKYIECCKWKCLPGSLWDR